MLTYRAMRKGAAVHNAVWHAVIPERCGMKGFAVCGTYPKTCWVDGGPVEHINCQKCRRTLVASGHDPAALSSTEKRQSE